MSTQNEHLFYGVHVLGELYGVDPQRLNDTELLEEAIKDGIIRSGASLCGLQTKKFDPVGVTILALLSESHTSIHTYPDQNSLFFDAFTCGETCRPELIAEALCEALEPTHHNLQIIKRGEIPGHFHLHSVPDVAIA